MQFLNLLLIKYSNLNVCHINKVITAEHEKQQMHVSVDEDDLDNSSENEMFWKYTSN